MLRLTGLTLVALFMPISSSGVKTLPLDAPSCATVRAEKFNDGLQVRRQITGNDQRFRNQPVCKALYGRLRRSVQRARGKCRANSTRDMASWYGPGFYGGGLAGGGTLSTSTVGVAHKTLPFGTRRFFHRAGRTREARVIDRGPFVAGREWDLTGALATALAFGGTGYVTVNRHNCWAVWR